MVAHSATLNRLATNTARAQFDHARLTTPMYMRTQNHACAIVAHTTIVSTYQSPLVLVIVATAIFVGSAALNPAKSVWKRGMKKTIRKITAPTASVSTTAG